MNRQSMIVAITLSPGLEAAMSAAEPTRYPGIDPNDPGFVLRSGDPIPLEHAAEAEMALAKYSMQPADYDFISNFLGAIAGTVRNPPDERRFAQCVAGVELICEDLPRWVFCREAQKRIVETEVYFPAPKDIKDHLIAASSSTLHRVRMLQSLVRRARPRAGFPQSIGEAVERATGERPRPTAEQIARARSAVEEMRAEAERKGDVLPIRPARPLHLSPEQLTKSRDGNPIVQAARRAAK